MNTPTQLTIEHLAAYLPYGVKVKSIDIFIGDPVFTLAAETISGTHAGMNWVLSDSFKLVLRPLSQLTEQITHNGETFVPMDRLGWVEKWGDASMGQIVYCEYGETPRTTVNVIDYIKDLQMISSWHFDVFDLIEAGLAVAMNPDGTIAQ